MIDPAIVTVACEWPALLITSTLKQVLAGELVVSNKAKSQTNYNSTARNIGWVHACHDTILFSLIEQPADQGADRNVGETLATLGWV